MRAAAAAALLASLALLVAACGRRDPEAPRAYADDAENHDFALDLPRRRVLFVRGAYPRKSYLGIQRLDGGRTRWLRLPGYALEGGVFPVSEDRAFALARPVTGDYNSPRSRPRGRTLLGVSLGEEKVLTHVEMPSDGRVYSVERGALIGASNGLFLAPTELMAAAPGSAAVAPDEPVIAATAWDTSGGSLRLFDAGSGKLLKRLEINSPGIVRPLGGGRWLLTLQTQEGRDAAALLERDGNVRVLLTADGMIETVVAGGGRVYAIAPTRGVRPDPRRTWLRPRQILVAPLDGSAPAWSAPWSQHRGELLAVDEAAGRLWYAVTDKDAAAVWSLPLEPGKLAAAATTVDGRGPVARAAVLAIAWVLAMVVAASAVMARWLVWRRP